MGDDLGDRILADLAGHPGTTAAEMSGRLDANPSIVTDLLRAAMRAGRCTRKMERPRNVWRWYPAPPAEDR